MTNLFVYGTLRHPEIWRRVAGNDHVMHSAVLPGFYVHSLVNRVYPAIQARIGSRAEGALITGIMPDQWLRLDAYEGGEYRRILVSLEIGSARVDSYTYAWCGESSLLDETPWCFDLFTKKHLERYLRAL